MKGTETSKGNYLQRENMKGTVFTGTQKRRELYLQKENVRGSVLTPNSDGSSIYGERTVKYKITPFPTKDPSQCWPACAHSHLLLLFSLGFSAADNACGFEAFSSGWIFFQFCCKPFHTCSIIIYIFCLHILIHAHCLCSGIGLPSFLSFSALCRKLLLSRNWPVQNGFQPESRGGVKLKN